MDTMGSVLLADDEQFFCHATAELLRHDGFSCDCAIDGPQAEQMLRARNYDVLVADIRMEGNAQLELVHHAQEFSPGMPVILVTGYPTLDTAIHSVHLPVVAYLRKPLDYQYLLSQIRGAAGHSQIRRTLVGVCQRLTDCTEQLQAMVQGRPAAESPAELIPLLLVRTIASCLSELVQLRATLGCDAPGRTLCQIIDCPRYAMHREAIEKTIEVLIGTKSSFKSKELAALRAELEQLLKNP
jgi:DNA-binding response OmpR family regulator